MARRAWSTLPNRGTIDHLTDRSRGGDHATGNLRLACKGRVDIPTRW
jgi:hypothetical protein